MSQDLENALNVRARVVGSGQKNELRVEGRIVKDIKEPRQRFMFIMKDKETKTWKVIHKNMKLISEDGGKLIFRSFSMQAIQFYIWQKQGVAYQQLFEENIESDSEAEAPDSQSVRETINSPKSRSTRIRSEIRSPSKRSKGADDATEGDHKENSGIYSLEPSTTTTTTTAISEPNENFNSNTASFSTHEPDVVCKDSHENESGSTLKKLTGSQKILHRGPKVGDSTRIQTQDATGVALPEFSGIFETGKTIADAFKTYSRSMKYSCDYEPALMEALWRFMQLLKPGNPPSSAVQMFIQFLNSRSSREMLREWMLFYGLSRLGDVHGQGFKEKFIDIFFDRLLILAPEQFRDQVDTILRERVRKCLSERRNQEFLPTFTLDSALKLDRHLFTSEDDMTFFSTNEQSGSVSFQKFLEDENVSTTSLGVSPVFWAYGVSKVNFQDHPILRFDPVTCCVEDNRSAFYGIREPKTLGDWISLYTYVVVKHCANVAPTSMPRTGASVSERARKMCESMEAGAPILLGRLYLQIFMLCPSVEATLWGQSMWRAFGQEKTTSQIHSLPRYTSLMVRRCNDHLMRICGDSAVAGTKLSLVSLMPSAKKSSTTSTPGRAVQVLPKVVLDIASLEDLEETLE